MSTRAGTAETLPRRREAPAPRSRPRPRPAPRTRPRPPAARRAPRQFPTGLILLPLIALLLGGIVWINVAKLDLATETGRVIEQSRAIQVETVTLRGQLERQDVLVTSRAEEQLGMEAAPGESITYLSLSRAGNAPE